MIEPREIACSLGLVATVAFTVPHVIEARRGSKKLEEGPLKMTDFDNHGRRVKND